MSQISRVYSFNDVATMLPSQVETEIFTIVNAWNNHDKGIDSFGAIVVDNIAVNYGGGIVFTSSSGALSSTIKYTINNFTIIGDPTNGVNITGNGGNISLGETSGSYGSGVKVLFIPDRSAAPSSNPTGGLIFYSESGDPWFRTSGGVVGAVVLTAGAQTIAGAKTFSNAAVFSSTVTVSGQAQLNGTSGNPVHGTNTNDNASAGYIGETTTSTASVAGPTSGQYGDLTSLSLTAGDWLVTAIANAAIAVNTSFIGIGISTTAGNSSTGLVLGDNLSYIQAASSIPLTDLAISVPSYRMSLSGTMTVYLKMSAIYTGTGPSFDGTLRAVRIR